MSNNNLSNNKSLQQLDILLSNIDNQLIELSNIFNRHFGDREHYKPYIQKVNDLLDSRLELQKELDAILEDLTKNFKKSELVEV